MTSGTESTDDRPPSRTGALLWGSLVWGGTAWDGSSGASRPGDRTGATSRGGCW